MSRVAASPSAPAPTRAAVAPFARGPVIAVGAFVTVLLIVVGGRYGYHRDELYFLASGRHLAWGYPDQPPLVPLIARAMSAIAPGSLTLLRTPSAISAGLVVVLTALTAREIGARRDGQIVAAVVMASGGILYGTGHLLSTSTFDLLAWAWIVWLVVRLLRTGNNRQWLLVGLVAGIGLLATDLVAFLMVGLMVGLLVAGPRHVLRSPYLWIGGVVALALWAPYLAWQGAHGWPELAVSRSIAVGKSGTSTPRAVFIPDQLLNLGPVVAPVWVYGLIRLFRDPAVRRWRPVGVAYVFLLVVFIALGGKSYYLAGMYPALVGARRPAHRRLAPPGRGQGAHDRLHRSRRRQLRRRRGDHASAGSRHRTARHADRGRQLRRGRDGGVADLRQGDRRRLPAGRGRTDQQLRRSGRR